MYIYIYTYMSYSAYIYAYTYAYIYAPMFLRASRLATMPYKMSQSAIALDSITHLG